MTLRPPKGTVHIKTFGPTEPVTPYRYSKRHGHLTLISARLLDPDKTMIAFYRKFKP